MQQPKIESDVTYNKEQASADTEAMAGFQFPEISDMQLQDYDQYASVSSAVTKPIKKYIQKTLKDFTPGTTSTATKKPREITGAGLETPADKAKKQKIEEGVDTLTTPPPTTDEMVTTLSKNEFLTYDKDNKPTYMPRADSKATYRLDQLDSDEDVDAAIQAMAEEFKFEIDDARRGVLTDDAAKQLAHDLSLNPERMKELLTRPDGSAASVEEIYAMRQMMDQSAKRLKSLSDKVADGSATPQELMDFEQSFLFQKDLLTKFMAYRAEAGRSVRAYGVNLGGGFGGAEEQRQMIDMAMAGYDMKKIAQIIQNADDVKGINAAIDGLSNVRKGLAALTTQFTYSILSGVQTQVVNIAGGAVQLGQSMFDRYLTEAGTRMRLLAGMDVEGLMAPGEAAVYRMSLTNSIRQSLSIAKKSLVTGENYGGVGKFQQFEDPFTPSYWGMDPNTPQAKLLTYYGNGTGFMVRNVMGASDGFFKSMAENAQYMALAYRKAWNDSYVMLKQGELGDEHFAKEVQKRFEDYVQNPTIDMQQEAKLHGKQITYQDSTPVGLGWQKFADTLPVLRFFTPFVNTPVSIVKQHLVDRSPLSLVFNRGVLYSNTVEGQMARTKLGAGMAMMGMFYMLAEDGYLTGSRPSDPKEAQLWEAAGKRPNSLVIPHSDGSKTYVDLSRIENISYLSSMVADLRTLYQQKEIDWEFEDSSTADKSMEVIALTLVSVIKSMEDKTFLQGVDTLMSLTSGTSSKARIENVKRAGSNIVVPTLMPLTSMQKDVNTWFVDDKRKDLSELKDRFQDAIATLKKEAPDRLDIWGLPLRDSQRGNPFKVTTTKKDPVMDELLRLTASTNRPPLGKPRRTILGFEMTSREYHDVVQYIRKDARDKKGRSFKEVIRDTIKQLKKEDVNDLLSVATIQKVTRDWDKGFALEYMKSNEELEQKYIKALNLRYAKQGKGE